MAQRDFPWEHKKQLVCVSCTRSRLTSCFRCSWHRKQILAGELNWNVDVLEEPEEIAALLSFEDEVGEALEALELEIDLIELISQYYHQSILWEKDVEALGTVDCSDEFGVLGTLGTLSSWDSFYDVLRRKDDYSYQTAVAIREAIREKFQESIHDSCEAEMSMPEGPDGIDTDETSGSGHNDHAHSEGRILIKNLSRRIDGPALYRMFEDWGPIRECRRTNADHDCAFVRFEKIEDARQAANYNNGMSILGREISVEVMTSSDFRAQQDAVRAAFKAAQAAFEAEKCRMSNMKVSEQKDGSASTQDCLLGSEFSRSDLVNHPVQMEFVGQRQVSLS